MVAFGVPERPQKAPRRSKQVVDNLSLLESTSSSSIHSDDNDLGTIQKALQSVFDAASGELDTFLAEGADNRPSSLETTTCTDHVAMHDNDDDSFASEERRLHESELLLRHALESVDNDDELCCRDASSSFHDANDAFALAFASGGAMHSNELNVGCLVSPSNVARPALRESGGDDENDAVLCAESYQSPESLVPLLQPVSPFHSPLSESSAGSSRRTSPSETAVWPTRKKEANACISVDSSSSGSITPHVPSFSLSSTHTNRQIIHSGSTSPTSTVSCTSVQSNESAKKRHIRHPYGLWPQTNDDNLDTMAGDVESSSLQQQQESRSNSKTWIGPFLLLLLQTALASMAKALFGSTHYTVRCRPFFSNTLRHQPCTYARTVQGTMSVWLALTIVVAKQCSISNSNFLLSLLLVGGLPLLLTLIEVKAPHKVDETTLAVVVLTAHVAMPYVSYGAVLALNRHHYE